MGSQKKDSLVLSGRLGGLWGRNGAEANSILEILSAPELVNTALSFLRAREADSLFWDPMESPEKSQIWGLRGSGAILTRF